MLPTPDTSDWSSSWRLIALAAAPHAPHEVGLVEVRVERVAADVRDLGRAAPLPVGDEQAAEHPLVDEAHLEGTLGGGQREPHPQVPLVGRARVVEQHLAAHAEVAEQRVAGAVVGDVVRVEREPEVLAAAPDGLDAAARPGRRRSRRPRAGRDAAGGCAAPRPPSMRAPVTWRSRPARTTSTSGSSGTGGRQGCGTSSGWASVSSPYAVLAAPCSASFLERPVPRP